MGKITRLMTDAIETLYRHEIFRPRGDPEETMIVDDTFSRCGIQFYDWSNPVDAVQLHTSYVVGHINSGTTPDLTQRQFLNQVMEFTGAVMVSMDGRDVLLFPLTANQKDRRFPPKHAEVSHEQIEAAE